MSSKPPSEGEWRSAVDPKTNRTYYYHTKTKATTWNKPLELATPEERRQMIALKEATERFFREMEDNISNKIEQARLQDEQERDYRNRLPTIVDEEEGFYSLDDRGSLYDAAEHKEIYNGLKPAVRSSSGGGSAAEAAVQEGRGRKSSFSGMGPPRRYRTISAMDDEMLINFRKNSIAVNNSSANATVTERRGSLYNQHSNYKSVPGSHNSNSVVDKYVDATADMKDMYGGSMEGIKYCSKEISDRVAEKYPVQPSPVEPRYLVDHMHSSSSNSPAKKKARGNNDEYLRRRRNSTGTIYLSNTMASQDNESTIEVVCVVIRLHMLDAQKENIEPLPQYDVFKDIGFSSSNGRGRDSKSDNQVPSLAIVKDFFMHLFSKSQLESDCIIMALIYCERLVKETKGKLCIRYDNWRSILFACLVMASKVWDDLSMWNVDFSQVYPSFNLQRVNALELGMLEALKYVIRVSASEYAKYYFHLRSMCSRLGLNSKAASQQPQQLDLATARKMQVSTAHYHHEEAGVFVSDATASRRRFYSVAETSTSKAAHVAANSKPVTVQLEHLIHAEHVHADGMSTKEKSGLSSKSNTPSKGSNPAAGKNLSPFADSKPRNPFSPSASGIKPSI